MRRLTAAVAEAGHSTSLLGATEERERELVQVNVARKQSDKRSSANPQQLREFALERLSKLPELLSLDVQLARADLSRHVHYITLKPSESNGDRHYPCFGEWNLLGTPKSSGDVRMVAGGGFEPPTFGL